LRQLYITTKDQRLIPFEPNWAQKIILRHIHQDLEDERPGRYYILKGRQFGVSTLAQALMFCWAIVFAPSNCTTAAHETEATEELFQKTKLFYETWGHRRKFRTKYSTRREMTFSKLHSSLRCMTAERKTAARSRTVQALHASEVAYFSDPVSVMTAFNNAVPKLPRTIQILESTANGIGNWWELNWQMAASGESEYTPIFLPWMAHPECIPCSGARCTDGTCDICTQAIRELGALDAEEKELSKKIPRWLGSEQVPLATDKAHLAWRRWAIVNDCTGSLDLFHQEYPSSPDEAFISSGMPAFNQKWIEACYRPEPYQRGRLVTGSGPGEVRWVEDAKGPIRMFKKPGADLEYAKYFIGADPTMGSYEGDYAAAHVVSRRNREQVAVWEGRINPINFADELARLGMFYNNAMIAPEIEGGGMGTIGRLSLIYDNIWQHRLPDRWPGKQMSNVLLGFSAGNYKRKYWSISKLGEDLERQTLTLHDRRTYEQLRAYQFYGAPGAAAYGTAAANDDLVDALAVTVLCESTEPKLDEWEVTPRRSDGLIFGERVDLRETIGAEYGWN
jgi:hypothetical protein